MSHKISGAQAKVEWANKHIEDFKDALVRFQNTNPYIVTSDQHPQTGELIYYMGQVADVPEEMVLVAGDVLQCLRTALDYLVCAHTQNPTSQTAFPIFDPAKVKKKYLEGKIGDMPPAAQKIVMDLKPYRGGNETLWKLHELNLIDKHRLLVAASTSLRSFNINQHRAYIRHGGAALLERNPENGQTFILKIAQDVYVDPSFKLFPLKAGDILLVDPPNTKVNENIDFRFNVAFNEPGVCEGDSILDTVKQCLDLVREIVVSFAQFP